MKIPATSKDPHKMSNGKRHRLQTKHRLKSAAINNSRIPIVVLEKLSVETSNNTPVKNLSRVLEAAEKFNNGRKNVIIKNCAVVINRSTILTNRKDEYRNKLEKPSSLEIGEGNLTKKVPLQNRTITRKPILSPKVVLKRLPLDLLKHQTSLLFNGCNSLDTSRVNGVRVHEKLHLLNPKDCSKDSKSNTSKVQNIACSQVRISNKKLKEEVKLQVDTKVTQGRKKQLISNLKTNELEISQEHDICNICKIKEKKKRIKYKSEEQEAKKCQINHREKTEKKEFEEQRKRIDCSLKDKEKSKDEKESNELSSNVEEKSNGSKNEKRSNDHLSENREKSLKSKDTVKRCPKSMKEKRALNDCVDRDLTSHQSSKNKRVMKGCPKSVKEKRAKTANIVQDELDHQSPKAKKTPRACPKSVKERRARKEFVKTNNLLNHLDVLEDRQTNLEERRPQTNLVEKRTTGQLLNDKDLVEKFLKNVKEKCANMEFVETTVLATSFEKVVTDEYIPNKTMEQSLEMRSKIMDEEGVIAHLTDPSEKEDTTKDCKMETEGKELQSVIVQEQKLNEFLDERDSTDKFKKNLEEQKIANEQEIKSSKDQKTKENSDTNINLKRAGKKMDELQNSNETLVGLGTLKLNNISAKEKRKRKHFVRNENLLLNDPEKSKVTEKKTQKTETPSESLEKQDVKRKCKISEMKRETSKLKIELNEEIGNALPKVIESVETVDIIRLCERNNEQENNTNYELNKKTKQICEAKKEVEAKFNTEQKLDDPIVFESNAKVNSEISTQNITTGIDSVLIELEETNEMIPENKSPEIEESNINYEIVNGNQNSSNIEQDFGELKEPANECKVIVEILPQMNDLAETIHEKLGGVIMKKASLECENEVISDNPDHETSINEPVDLSEVDIKDSTDKQISFDSSTRDEISTLVSTKSIETEIRVNVDEIQEPNIKKKTADNRVPNIVHEHTLDEDQMKDIRKIIGIDETVDIVHDKIEEFRTDTSDRDAVIQLEKDRPAKKIVKHQILQSENRTIEKEKLKNDEPDKREHRKLVSFAQEKYLMEKERIKKESINIITYIPGEQDGQVLSFDIPHHEQEIVVEDDSIPNKEISKDNLTKSQKIISNYQIIRKYQESNSSKETHEIKDDGGADSDFESVSSEILSSGCENDSKSVQEKSDRVKSIREKEIEISQNNQESHMEHEVFIDVPVYEQEVEVASDHILEEGNVQIEISEELVGQNIHISEAEICTEENIIPDEGRTEISEKEIRINNDLNTQKEIEDQKDESEDFIADEQSIKESNTEVEVPRLEIEKYIKSGEISTERNDIVREGSKTEIGNDTTSDEISIDQGKVQYEQGNVPSKDSNMKEITDETSEKESIEQYNTGVFEQEICMYVPEHEQEIEIECFNSEETNECFPTHNFVHGIPNEHEIYTDAPDIQQEIEIENDSIHEEETSESQCKVVICGNKEDGSYDICRKINEDQELVDNQTQEVGYISEEETDQDQEDVVDGNQGAQNDCITEDVIGEENGDESPSGEKKDEQAVYPTQKIEIRVVGNHSVSGEESDVCQEKITCKTQETERESATKEKTVYKQQEIACKGLKVEKDSAAEDSNEKQDDIRVNRGLDSISSQEEGSNECQRGMTSEECEIEKYSITEKETDENQKEIAHEAKEIENNSTSEEDRHDKKDDITTEARENEKNSVSEVETDGNKEKIIHETRETDGGSASEEEIDGNRGEISVEAQETDGDSASEEEVDLNKEAITHQARAIERNSSLEGETNQNKKEIIRQDRAIGKDSSSEKEIDGYRRENTNEVRGNDGDSAPKGEIDENVAEVTCEAHEIKNDFASKDSDDKQEDNVCGNQMIKSLSSPEGKSNNTQVVIEPETQEILTENDSINESPEKSGEATSANEKTEIMTKNIPEREIMTDSASDKKIDDEIATDTPCDNQVNDSEKERNDEEKQSMTDNSSIEKETSNNIKNGISEDGKSNDFDNSISMKSTNLEKVFVNHEKEVTPVETQDATTICEARREVTESDNLDKEKSMENAKIPPKSMTTDENNRSNNRDLLTYLGIRERVADDNVLVQSKVTKRVEELCRREVLFKQHVNKYINLHRRSVKNKKILNKKKNRSKSTKKSIRTKIKNQPKLHTKNKKHCDNKCMDVSEVESSNSDRNECKKLLERKFSGNKSNQTVPTCRKDLFLKKIAEEFAYNNTKDKNESSSDVIETDNDYGKSESESTSQGSTILCTNNKEMTEGVDLRQFLRDNIEVEVIKASDMDKMSKNAIYHKNEHNRTEASNRTTCINNIKEQIIRDWSSGGEEFSDNDSVVECWSDEDNFIRMGSRKVIIYPGSGVNNSPEKKEDISLTLEEAYKKIVADMSVNNSKSLMSDENIQYLNKVPELLHISDSSEEGESESIAKNESSTTRNLNQQIYSNPVVRNKKTNVQNLPNNQSVKNERSLLKSNWSENLSNGQQATPATAPTRCIKCRGLYINKQKMLEHLSSCGETLDLFCRICRQKFRYRRSLMRHLHDYHQTDVHSPEDLTKMIDDIIDRARKEVPDHIILYCASCSTNYKHLPAIYYRKICEKCNSRLTISCKRCKKTYSLSPRVDSHIQGKCEEYKLKKCNQCDYATVSYSKLQRHTLRKHTRIEVDDYQVCAKGCGRQFRLRDSRLKHEKLCGKEPDKYCKFCPFKTKYRSAIRMHMQQHIVQDRVAIYGRTIEILETSDFTTKNLLGRKEMQGTVESQCTNCKYTIVTEVQRKHCVRCSQPNIHVCKICRFANESLYQVKVHVLRRHTEKKLFCPQCGKKYAYAIDLRKHQLACNQPVVHCDECSFRTKGKKGLLNHKIRMHPNEDSKRLNCNKCGKIFQSPATLRKHESVYCGVEPKLSCAHCNFRTKTKFSLLRHIQNMHQEIYDYFKFHCDKCEKSFNDLFAFETHIISCRQNHSDGDYSCSNCVFRSKCKYSLLRHIQTVHSAECESFDFSCDKCGLFFPSVLSYNTHLNTCLKRFGTAPTITSQE